MTIRQAQPMQAREIARLIMVAMNHDCCRYFAGPHHTLKDFEDLMTALCEREDSQYSYRNTLVAIDEEGHLAGICVSYDGAQLHPLRRAFIEESKTRLGMDHSAIADETQAGELYIDSICVDDRFRGKGIATQLIRATIDKARALGLPAVGLLVDKGNPLAEKLYLRNGFVYQNDASWGGHPMKHLVAATAER